MINVFIAALGLIIIAAAILALLHPNLVTSILAAGAVSLVASVLYLFLAAPDVAMTEAAIGSALTTVVFLFALSRLRTRANRKTAATTDETEAKNGE